MEFYRQLSRYYDSLFPPSTEQKAWALGFADSAGPLLDAGCATGELALTLAAAGFRTFGFDSDAEMIDRATAKAAGMPGPPEFRVDTLQHCARHYRAGYFSTLLCLGNTLVHLDGRAELIPVMKGFAGLLGRGGRAAIQLLNYDRILSLRPDTLPPLKAERDGVEIIFERRYRYGNEKVVFEGVLTVRKNGEEESAGAETELLPLRGAELKEAARAAGFASVGLFGDYGRTEADETSFFYLLTAEKPA